MSDFSSLFNEVHADLSQLSQQLFDLQASCAQGRGLQNLQAASNALSRGDLNFARSAIYNNWDKLESYPDLRQWLIANGLGPIPPDWAKYF